ncbi:Uncharacterised protein [Halioglobus japonicus]|nr:Uncharacterised protein [Halioglobus japonicus]
MIERPSAINPVFILQRQSLVIRLCRGGMQALLLLLLVTGLASCEKEGALLAEQEYRSALVGQWQGNVGDESESISFEEDGSFSSQVRSNGFIGATLGQGTTGKVGGSWTLQGNVITLAIDQVSKESPLNLATVSTIVSFHQNQLVVKSDSGETSTFVRAM